MKRIITLCLLACLTLTLSEAQTTYDNFDNARLVDIGGYNGQYFEYVPNPDMLGNPSPMVGQHVRDGFQLFDVVILETGLMQDLTPYVNGTKQITMDVYAPDSGITVQFTLEDTTLANDTNFPVGRHSIYTAQTTKSLEWETLTFSFDSKPDLTVPNTSVNRMVLLFNPNSMVFENYFYDNLNGPELTNNPCTAPLDPLVINDLECNHNLTVTFRHGDMRKVFNPNPSPLNNSKNALRYVRNGGVLDDVVVGRFEVPVDIQTGTKIKMHVYDSNAPSIIALALQDSTGADIVVPTDTTSITGQWQELTFDLSAGAGGNEVKQYVLLYEPGVFTSDAVHYDNIRIEQPAPACAPVTSSTQPIIKVDAVRIDWTTIPGATKYIITGGPSQQNPNNWVKIVRNAPPLDVANLGEGTTYNYRIITICGPDTAAPSDLFSFTTNLCTPPASNFTSGVTMTSAVLNWTQAPDAKRYEIVGQKVPGGSIVTLVVPGGATTSKPVAGLTCGTTYQWSVRSVCRTASPVVKSDLGGVSVFSTVACRLQNPNDNYEGIADFAVFPNPATNEVNISWTEDDKMLGIEIYSTSGQLMYQQNGNEDGLQLTVNTSNWAKGMYQLRIQTENGIASKKVAIIK